MCSHAAFIRIHMESPESQSLPQCRTDRATTMKKRSGHCGGTARDVIFAHFLNQRVPRMNTNRNADSTQDRQRCAPLSRQKMRTVRTGRHNARAQYRSTGTHPADRAIGTGRFHFASRKAIGQPRPTRCRSKRRRAKLTTVRYRPHVARRTARGLVRKWTDEP